MKLDSKHGLLSIVEFARMEKEAIEAGVSADAMMEQAGKHIADVIFRQFKPTPVLVLCGPGNNGGDGYVVARHLNEKGWEVTVAALEENGKNPTKAATRYKGRNIAFSPQALKGKGLVVDALFGSGLKRPIKGAAKEMLQALAASHIPVVAVDVPSGVNGSNGQILGIAAPATITVTFERKKQGHVLLPAKAYCGEVVVRPIGVPKTLWEKRAFSCFENGPELWSQLIPWPKITGHKYSRGHAIIVAGGRVGTKGAGLLGSVAALRVGAGLVTIACPETAVDFYAQRYASLMTRPIADAKALRLFLIEPHRDAVLIGPGAGISDRTRKMVLTILKEHKPCVLDADALTSFIGEPKALFKAIKACAAPVVITPHEGEFRNLFGTMAWMETAEDAIARALSAAETSGAVVVLKGSDTVIATPKGLTVVNTNAPPTLATAGAGDVLAGMITGLLAGGMEAVAAACAGAWIHGECANRFGLGLISDDLPGMIPGVLQQLFTAPPF